MSLISRFRRASSAAWPRKQSSINQHNNSTRDRAGWGHGAAHHVELGLSLLHHAVLLRLRYADEDPQLRVELQDAALQPCDEVAEAPDAADPNDGLQRCTETGETSW